jgi:hypothetical protein
MIEKKGFHVENSTTPYIHTPTTEAMTAACNILRLQPISQEASHLVLRETLEKPPQEFWGSYIVTQATQKIERDQIPRIESYPSVARPI